MICTYKLLTFILMPFCVWSKKIVTFIFKYNNGKILEPYMTLTKNDFQKGAESWYNLLTCVLMHLCVHTGLICSRSIQNHAFKGCLSLETMKLWQLVLTRKLFLMTLIIKLTLGNIFIKMKNPPGGAIVTK